MENAPSISVRNAIIAWSLVAVWMVFIFFMSAHTGSDLIEGDDIVAMVKRFLNGVQEAIFGPGVDVVSSIAHFFEYMVFGCLVCVALNESGFKAKRISNGAAGMSAMIGLIAVTVIFCAVYAASDEFHQYFVPGRACDPVDWIVDVCGTTVGAWLMCLVISRR